MLYGLPLVPHALSAWITSLSDRLILAQYVSLSAIGVYSVGYTIAGLLSMLITSVNYAYTPFFMRSMRDYGDEGAALVGRVATFVVAFDVLAFLVLAVCSRPLLALLAPASYASANSVIRIVSLGLLFQGWYYIVANPIVYNKSAVKYLPLASVVAAGVNLGLNFLLIPWVGGIGAALATVGAYAALAVVATMVSRRVQPIPVETGKLIWLAFTGLAAFGVVVVGDHLVSDGVWSFALGGSALLSYCVGLFAFGVIPLTAVRQAVERGRVRARGPRG